jgi:TRAP-type mannitol/chloroaromatic compound transport system permease small subunit
LWTPAAQPALPAAPAAARRGPIVRKELRSMNAADRVTRIIDAISIWTGKAVAWLILPMFGVLVFEVLVRKLYQPTIWANDVATMAYGTHFSLAAAYALSLQKHIRTDFLTQHLSLRSQLWLDLIQYVFFFLPGMVMFLWLSWEFAEESWFFREELITSWRPPAYLYKTVIPITAALLLLQGFAEVLKCFRALQTGVDYRKVEPTEVT